MMPKLNEINDLDLMEMVKKGRKDAFVEIVHRHQRPLLNFFRKMGAVRYLTGMALVLLMYGIVVKIILRLAFNIRYILATPWFNI